MLATHKVAILTIMTAMTAVSGCASLHDKHYEKCQKFRTTKAWYQYWWNSDEKYSCDYKEGWEAGYFDVLTGNPGKPPMFPPKKYWNPHQITHNCDLNRYEWYIGFNDGANCARRNPDTHYIRPWMPEYCEPGIQGTNLDEPMLEPYPAVEVPSSEADLTAPLVPAPASN